MDEKERKRKLQAGKEKLAQFQKKKQVSPEKRKKKKKTQAAGGEEDEKPKSQIGISPDADYNDLNSSSDFYSPSYEESDHCSTTADDMSSEELEVVSGEIARVELRRATQKINQLEENLLGKETALEELRTKLSQGNLTRTENNNNEGCLNDITDLQLAITQRDEIISHLTNNLQTLAQSHDTAEGEASTQVQHLILEMHEVKVNLQQATEELIQRATDHSTLLKNLHESKNHILYLQQQNEEKEKVLQYLKDHFSQKSEELIEVKNKNQRLNLDLIKSSNEVKSLMRDLEKSQLKLGLQDVNETVDMKLSTLKTELEEAHGNHINIIKEELFAQYQLELSDICNQLQKAFDDKIIAEVELTNLKHKCSDMDSLQNKFSACLRTQQQLEKEVQEWRTKYSDLIKNNGLDRIDSSDSADFKFIPNKMTNLGEENQIMEIDRLNQLHSQEIRKIKEESELYTRQLLDNLNNQIVNVQNIMQKQMPNIEIYKFDDKSISQIQCYFEIIINNLKLIFEKEEKEKKLIEQQFHEKLKNFNSHENDTDAMKYIEHLKEEHDIQLQEIEDHLREIHELNWQKKEKELNLENDKKMKEYGEEIERTYLQKIEAIKIQKDKEFVEEMQKVHAEYLESHVKDIESQALRRDVPHHIGEDANLENSKLINQLIQKNQELQDAKKILLEQLDGMHHKLEELQEEILFLSNERDRFLAENKKLTSELKIFSGQNCPSSELEFRIKYENLKVEYENLLAKLKSLNMSDEKSCQENSNFTNGHELYSEMNFNVEGKISDQEDWKTRFLSLSQEFELYKDKNCVDFTLNDLQSSLDATIKEKNDLEKKLQELEMSNWKTKFHELSQEYEALRYHLQEGHPESNNFDHLQGLSPQSLADWKNKYELLSKEYCCLKSQLEMELVEPKSGMHSLLSETWSVDTQTVWETTDNETHSEDDDAALTWKIQHDSDVSNLVQSKEKQRNEIFVLKENITKLEDENKQLQRLSSTNYIMSIDVSVQTDILSENNLNTNSIEKSLAISKDTFSESELKFDDLFKELSELKLQVQNNDQWKAKFEQVAEEKLELQIMIQQIEESSLKIKYDKLNNEYNEIKTHLHEMNVKGSILHKNDEINYKRLQEEYCEMLIQKNSLEERLSEQETKLFEIEKEQAEVENLRHERNCLEEKFLNQVNIFEQEKHDLQQTIMDLQISCDSLQTVKEDLEADLKLQLEKYEKLLAESRIVFLKMQGKEEQEIEQIILDFAVAEKELNNLKHDLRTERIQKEVLIAKTNIMKHENNSYSHRQKELRLELWNIQEKLENSWKEQQQLLKELSLAQKDYSAMKMKYENELECLHEKLHADKISDEEMKNIKVEKVALLGTKTSNDDSLLETMMKQIQLLKDELDNTKQKSTQKVNSLKIALSIEKQITDDIQKYLSFIGYDSEDIIRSVKNLICLKNDLEKENQEIFKQKSNLEDVLKNLQNKISTSNLASTEVQEVFEKHLVALQKQHVEFQTEIESWKQNKKSEILFLNEKLLLESNLKKEQDLKNAALEEKNNLEILLTQQEQQSKHLFQEIQRISELMQEKDQNERKLMLRKCTLEHNLKISHQKLEELGILIYDKSQMERDLWRCNLSLHKMEVDAKEKEIEFDIRENSLKFHNQEITEQIRLKLEQENLEQIEQKKREAEIKHASAIARLRWEMEQDYTLRESKLLEQHTSDISSLKAKYKEQLEILQSEYEKKIYDLEQQLEQKKLSSSTSLNEQELMEFQLKYAEKLTLIRSTLDNDQQEQFDSLKTKLEKIHAEEFAKLEEEYQVKLETELLTLKQKLIAKFSEDSEVLKAQLNHEKSVAILDLRESLNKSHKNDLNLFEKEWILKLDNIKEEYESKLEQQTISGESSQVLLEKLRCKMTEGHQKTVEKLNQEWCQKYLSYLERIHKEVEEKQLLNSEHFSSENEVDSKDNNGILNDREILVEQAEGMKQWLKLHEAEMSQLSSCFQSEFDQLNEMRHEMFKQNETLENHLDSLTSEYNELKNKHEIEIKDYQDKVQTLHKLIPEESENSEGYLQRQLSNLREKLEAEHMQEMEELRKYFEKRVEETEKNFSNEVIALKSKYEGIRTEVSTSKDSDPNSSMSLIPEPETQVLSLPPKLEELESQYEKQAKETLEWYKEQLESFRLTVEAEHAAKIENLKISMGESFDIEEEKLRLELMAKYESEIILLNAHHCEEIENLRSKFADDMGKEITKVRIECASETAKQVEIETNEIRSELKQQHELELNGLQLELEDKHKKDFEEFNIQKVAEIKKVTSELIQKYEKELENLRTKLEAEYVQNLSVELKNVKSEMEVQIQEAIRETEINLTEEFNFENKKKLEELKSEYETKIQNVKEENQQELAKNQETFKLEVNILKSKLNDCHVKQTDPLINEDNNILEFKKSVESDYEKKLELAKNKMTSEFDELIKNLNEMSSKEMENKQNEFMKEHEHLMDEVIKEQQKEIILLKEHHCEELKLLEERLTTFHLTELKQLQDSYETEIDKIKKYHDENLKSNQELWEKEKMDEIAHIKFASKEAATNFDKEITTIKSHHSEEIEILKRQIKEELVVEHIQKFEDITTELECNHKQDLEELKSNLNKEYIESLEQLQHDLTKKEEEYQYMIQALKEDHEKEIETLKKQLTERIATEMEKSCAELKKSHIEEIQSILSKNDIMKSELNEAHHNDIKELQKKWDSKHQTELQNIYLNHKEKIEKLEKNHNDQISELLQEKEIIIQEKQAELQLQQEHNLELEKCNLESQLQDLKEQYESMMKRRDQDQEEGSTHISRVQIENSQLHQANNHILQILAEIVKSNIAIEDFINKQFQEIVHERKQKALFYGGQGDTTHVFTVSGERYIMGGSGDAAHFSMPLLSEQTADLSQRIRENLFEGPYLSSDAEEIITDANVRLHSAVRKIFEMFAFNVKETKSTVIIEKEIKENTTENNEEIIQLKHENEILKEHLEQECKSKDYLLIELNKAEGLVKSYESEKISLEGVILRQEEAQANLLSELEHLNSKIQNFEKNEATIQEEKEYLLHQRNLLSQPLVNKEKDMLDAWVQSTPLDEQVLLQENTQLNKEKCELQQQMERIGLAQQKRIRELEMLVEEVQLESEKLSDEKINEILDTRRQVEALEKQLKASKQFLEEQTIEREQEREEFQKELQKLEEKVREKEKVENAEGRLAREVNFLEQQLKDKIDTVNEVLLKKEQLERDLKNKIDREQQLQETVRDLEHQLDEKIKAEHELIKEIELFKSVLTKQHEDNEKLSQQLEEIRAISTAQLQEQIHQLQLQLEMKTKSEQITQQKKLELENELKKQRTLEEELQQDKETLQQQVYQQLLQVSELKAKVDEQKYNIGSGDLSHKLALLQIQLQEKHNNLEMREKEITDLAKELDHLREKLMEQAQEINSKEIWLQNQNQQHNLELENKMKNLKEENGKLETTIKQLKDQLDVTPTPVFFQNLIDEKNQEIGHLNQQLKNFQEHLITVGINQDDITKLLRDLEDKNLELSEKTQEIERLRITVDEMKDQDETPQISSVSVPESSDIENQEKQISDLKDLLLMREKEIEDLRREIFIKDADILSLQTEFERKQNDEVLLLNEVIQDKEQYIEQLNVQVSTMQTEIENLNDFQVQQTLQVNKLQEDFDTVQRMLEDKQTELMALQQELENFRPLGDGFTHEQARLETHIRTLENEVCIREQLLEDKEELLLKLSQQLEEISDKHAHTQDEMRKEIISLRETVMQRDTEIEHLLQQLQEAMKNIDMGPKEFEKMSKEIEDLQKQLELKEIEINNMQVEIKHQPLGDENPEISSSVISHAELEKLRDELDDYKTQLLIFKSTLPSKTYEKQLKELKEELTKDHQHHITDIQKNAEKDAMARVEELENKHRDEIQLLKHEHKIQMDENISLVKKELQTFYTDEIERLRDSSRRNDNLEFTHNDSSALPEISQRLYSEIETSSRLDANLLGALKKRQEGVGRDSSPPTDNSSSESYSEALSDTSVPSTLQSLLSRLHKEGVQVLTLSELQFLRQQRAATQTIDADTDLEALQKAWDNEKQHLLGTIEGLKALLFKTSAAGRLTEFSDDWRGELVQSIQSVFLKEREVLMAELRTYVVSHGNVSTSEIQNLDSKIRELMLYQKSALQQIQNADRTSLLSEINDLRKKLSTTSFKHQEECQKINDQLSLVEEQGNKRERQLKRQMELLEYKLHVEKILAEDLRTSLEIEKSRTIELSSNLNREKIQTTDLELEISNATLEINRLQDNLEKKHSHVISLSTALESEKLQTKTLSEGMAQERSNLVLFQERLECEKRRLRIIHERDQQSIQELKQALDKEKELRMDLSKALERERLASSSIQRELEGIQEQHKESVNALKNKLGGIESALALEKLRVEELERQEHAPARIEYGALQRERHFSQQLRDNLEAERGSQLEISLRDKTTVADIQAVLDLERNKILELQTALERERYKISSLNKTLDDERNRATEELETEKATYRQQKKSLDSLQTQKQELQKQLLAERDRAARLINERDRFSAQLTSLQEREHEKEKFREEERQIENERQRKREIEKEQERQKQREFDLELQQYRQRFQELQHIIDELKLREKQLSSELELERSLHRNSVNLLKGEEILREQQISLQQFDSKSLGQNKELINYYKSQMEFLRQHLQRIAIHLEEECAKKLHSIQDPQSLPSVNEIQKLHQSISEILIELKQLQTALASDSELSLEISEKSSAAVFSERILKQNADLLNSLSQLSQDKLELRFTLAKLEDEVWRYRQKDSEIRQSARKTLETSESVLLAERNAWLHERNTLQNALSKADSRIIFLNTELHKRNLELDKLKEQVISGSLSSDSRTEETKVQMLFGKYLRSESFRKALVYQKKYLLILLGGFQDTEETTLSTLAKMGVYPSEKDLQQRLRHSRAFIHFRSAVRVVIAITRMKFLVKKWRRLVRIGSPIITGRVGILREENITSGGHRITPYSPPHTRYGAILSNSTNAITPSFHFGPAENASGRTPPVKDFSSTVHIHSDTSSVRRSLVSTSTNPTSSSQQSNSTLSNRPITSSNASSLGFSQQLETVLQQLNEEKINSIARSQDYESPSFQR